MRKNFAQTAAPTARFKDTTFYVPCQLWKFNVILERYLGRTAKTEPKRLRPLRKYCAKHYFVDSRNITWWPRTVRGGTSRPVMASRSIRQAVAPSRSASNCTAVMVGSVSRRISLS